MKQFFPVTVAFETKELKDLVLSDTMFILKLESKTSHPIVIKSQPDFYHRVN